MDNDLLEPRMPVAEHEDLIPAIYNYCDRWCERCRFTTRCGVFRMAASAGQEGASHCDDTGAAEPGSDHAPVAMARPDVDVSMTDEEWDAVARREEARHEMARADPIVVQARTYVARASPIVRALEPVLADRGDAVALDALEIIGRLMWTISGKTYRAVSGSLDEDRDPDTDPRDDLGSAKVARLAIRDSRLAWRVLMTVGRATADGVPARLVASLEALDEGLTERFPEAMAFLRPGFDTEARNA
jgi:hypothetical protein